MTTSCDCAYSEARAKLEGVVTTLRVMRAGLEVLGEQIDQMLAAAESGQKRASQDTRPENSAPPTEAGAGAPEVSPETDASSHDAVASDGLVDRVVAEIADWTGDVSALFTGRAAAAEHNEAPPADSDASSQSPSVAVPAEISSLFQMPTATQTEPQQAGDEVCPEDRALPTATGEREFSGPLEADVSIISAAASEDDDHPAVVELANYPRDFGALFAIETKASEQETALHAQSDAGSDSSAVGVPPIEDRADEDPMSNEITAAVDGPWTSSDKTMKTESASEAGTETVADHNVTECCSEEPAAPASEDAAESATRESNVIILPRRRRRVLRNLAASVAAILVFAGLVTATKLDTLGGLTNLAHATGLR